MMDYSEMQLEDNFFGDGDHVNALGADTITRLLQETMKIIRNKKNEQSVD